MRLLVLHAGGPALAPDGPVRGALDRAQDGLDAGVTLRDLSRLDVGASPALTGEEDGERLLRDLDAADDLLAVLDGAPGPVTASLEQLLRRRGTRQPLPLAVVRGAGDGADVDDRLRRLGLAPVGPGLVLGDPRDAARLDALLDELDRVVHRS